MGESRRLRVQQKTFEAEGVTSVTFVDPTGAELPGWTPGSHIALSLPGGLVREYSLCSDPLDSSLWTVAVLRSPDSRGGSIAVHESLHVGDLITVEGPRDNFAIDPDAAHHVLVAGGVGITPIIAMVRDLEGRGADWRLLYAGRSRATMAFLDELKVLAPSRTTIHADDETDGFPDVGSFLNALLDGTTVYACGPAPLLDTCQTAMPSNAALRIERFAAPTPVVRDGEEQSFEVVIHSTGARVLVDAGTTVLDALRGIGVDLPSSCTEGICGTCEVGVLKGDVDHRDFVLSPDEQEIGATMFPCVSRCRSSELILAL